MAANLKSTIISNRDATPKLLTDALVSGGQINETYGWVYTGASDAAGSTYRLCMVPSEARVSTLSWVNNALGSGCVLDVAAWYPTNFQSGGGAFLSQSLTSTLISSSAFATQITGNTANVTYTNILTTTGFMAGPNYMEQPIWVLIGLAADPECAIDLGFTVRNAVSSQGYIGMKASYTF